MQNDVPGETCPSQGSQPGIELMMSGLRAILVPGLDSLPRQLGGCLSRQQFCRSSQDLGSIGVFLLVSLLIFDAGVLGVSLLFFVLSGCGLFVHLLLS